MGGGHEIVSVLRGAMHGEIDPSTINEDWVREWQEPGWTLEKEAVAAGSLSVNQWLEHSPHARGLVRAVAQGEGLPSAEAVPEDSADLGVDGAHEVDEVVARYPGNVPEPMAALMRLTVGYATDALARGQEGGRDVQRDAGLAMSLATLGYLYRQVQVEPAPTSKVPIPDLTVKLVEARAANPQLDWPSLLAVAAAEQLGEMDLFAQEGSPQIDPAVAGRLFGLYAPGPDDGGMTDVDSSRCFEFGWLLRCFEDSLPSDASL